MTKRRPFGRIRQLKSQRWQAAYVGPDKTRYNAPRTFQFHTHARDWLKKQESLIILGQWTPPTSIPIAEAFQNVLFLEFAKRHIDIQTVVAGRGIRPSTQELYERLLKNHLSIFHSMPMAKITTSLVNDWWATELKSKKFTTAAKAYTLLSAIMARGVREEVVKTNPCQVRGARLTKTGIKVEIPTREEVSLLCEISEHNFGLMVSLMAFGGLRFGECVSLTLGDFEPYTDTDGSLFYRVNVDKSATVVGGQVRLGPPKSLHSVRKVWLNAEVSQGLHTFLSSNAASPKMLAFQSPSGTIWRNDSFHRVWKRMLKATKIEGKRLTPHSLRHFGATTFHAAGGGIPELKAYLGDSSTSAVVGYLQQTDNQLEIVRRMSE